MFKRGIAAWLILVMIFSMCFSMAITASAQSSELLSNPGFESGTTGWYGQMATISTDTVNVNSGSSSLKISDRSVDYSTAVQDVTSLLRSYGNGNYNISGYAKLAEDVSCSPLIIIKYNDDNGDHYAATDRTAINNTDFTKLEKQVAISWTGTLNYAHMYIQTGLGGNECPTTDLYIDDFSLINPDYVAPPQVQSPELLNNPGFEGGTSGWSPENGSTITLDTGNVNSGVNSLKISDRSADWSSASQNVMNALKSYGPGNYRFTGYVKLSSGTASPAIVLKINGNSYFSTDWIPVDANGFTKIEKNINITWSGKLTSAVLYIQTGTSGGDYTDDLYIDDFSLVNLDRAEPIQLNQPGPANLALGKTVTASSTQTHYSPSYIVNGENDTSSWTHWAADVSQGPQWVEIDFAEDIILNRIEMYLMNPYTQKGYEVQYLDGEEWKNCFGKVMNNTEVHNSYTFSCITTSKLRVYMTEGNVLQDGVGGSENIARIVEVEVYYDRNYAFNRPVTASSTQPGYSPSNIVNGNEDTNTWTHWATDVSQGPQWVIIDFGSSTTFKRVEFYTMSGYEQKGYEIQYWDGMDWVNCFPKVSNNTLDHITHNFGEVTSDKLRVYLTEGNVQQYGQGGAENVARIVQVEVYNTSGVSVDNTNYPDPIPQSIEDRQEKTVVGAIRWDAWGGTSSATDPGTQTQRSLSPEKYHFRLPWYATVTGENTVSIPEYTQDIVDKEIQYAKNAGIDYWAFVMYQDDGNNTQPLNRARDLYLSSEYKNDVKWCALLGASNYQSSNYPWLVSQFKNQNYQKVLNGRPLIYLWSTNKSTVDALRLECSFQGVNEPYIVVMGTNGKTMKQMQGDALSAYTGFGGNGSPYSSIAIKDQSNWDLWESYGAQVVPMVTAGWDPRPRIDNPVSWTSYGEDQWAQTGTPREIADNLKAALSWNKSHRSSSYPNAVLMYAWNENDEGGWIIPTYDPSNADTPNTARLDAIQEVISDYHDSTLSGIIAGGLNIGGFTPDVRSYNVKLPAGTTAAPFVAATPSNANAEVTVTQASVLPGEAIITVSAEDGITESTYKVIFEVDTNDNNNNDNDNNNNDKNSNTENTNKGRETTKVVTIGDSTKIIAKPVSNIDTGIAALTILQDTINEALTAAKQNTYGVKEITIEVSAAEGAKTYSLGLPASVLASETLDKVIEIKTPVAEITVPGNMFGKTKPDIGKSIEIVVKNYDISALDSESQKQIGGRPVIDLSVKIDGREIIYNNPGAAVKVSIDYKPSENELLDPEHIVVYYIDEKGSLIPISDGKYEKDSGKVAFTITHFSKYAVAYVKKTFSDIDKYPWIVKPVEVLASKGVLEGAPGNLFSPEKSIARGEYVMWLVKAMGLTTELGESFSDVNGTDNYYEALVIAKKLGIAKGTGRNMFKPETAISRQDMMVLTIRALKVKNKKLTLGTVTDINNFVDSDQVSTYAVDDVATLIKSGIIKGNDNKLNPTISTSRAEAAQVIYRIYCY